jgi:molybdate transport system substrate-binding protein
MRTIRQLLVLFAIISVPLAAAEISTLAGAAVQGPLLEMAKTFQEQTGHVVKVEFDTTPNIVRRLGGGNVGADVLIATRAAIDQAIMDGRAMAPTRVSLGRIGIGVAVSKGAAKPDISTPDALKAAILKADAVITSQGTSGTYVTKLLADLGVAEQIKAKTVQVAGGGAVMERLASSKNEIGFTMLSEVIYGEAHGGGTLVGPLPRMIQNVTGYDAVVTTGAKSPEEARQFLRALTSPAGRKLMVASGWEVPGVRAQ